MPPYTSTPPPTRPSDPATLMQGNKGPVTLEEARGGRTLERGYKGGRGMEKDGKGWRCQEDAIGDSLMRELCSVNLPPSPPLKRFEMVVYFKPQVTPQGSSTAKKG